MGNKIIRFEYKFYVVGTLKHVNMFLEIFQLIRKFIRNFIKRVHYSSIKV